MDIDITFITGVGAVVSAVIVFCGSVWLLLATILGARLAYFVTASITLAFVLIMSLVWSFGTPLGPVGEFGKPTAASLPHWEGVAISEEGGELDFAQAESYPDGPWYAPNQEDQEQVNRLSELEGDAADYLQEAIDKKQIGGFEDAEDTVAVDDSGRLLDTDEGQYGMVLLELSESAAQDAAVGEYLGVQEPEDRDELDLEQEVRTRVDEAGQVAVVMRFEQGNPLSKARIIAAGTFLLFLLHLLGLSSSERRVRRLREARGTA